VVVAAGPGDQRDGDQRDRIDDSHS